MAKLPQTGKQTNRQTLKKGSAVSKKGYQKEPCQNEETPPIASEHVSLSNQLA